MAGVRCVDTWSNCVCMFSFLPPLSLAEGEGQLSGESAGLVEQCCEMYNKARHKDGVSHY